MTLRLPNSAGSGPTQQAPGSHPRSHGPERRHCDSRSQVPNYEATCIDSLEGNPALNPEATASPSPNFFEWSSLSPDLPYPPIPLPQIRRIKEDSAGLTIHRNLDGPAEAEQAEEEGCVDPGRWLLPGHPEHWASLPAPWPTASSRCNWASRTELSCGKKCDDR